ncbi:hypothetical protein ACFOY4_35150 [Actinomadura syzygii]|uniref:PPE domain-containing protein n=1 Tax=Actinomadura syzygii TaxID=1427538 RepID=A0A5D0U0B7_9ACTN|nr:hypothetical protein [Actinomadura syzygii]TYC11203.1 hypothetical protein FXF65_30130 [Actinomadura syzygii]
MPDDKDISPDDDKYDGWDWRKIKMAITGSVNTDFQTAQNSLGGTSNPSTLVTAGGHFDAAYTALDSTWQNMKAGTDSLVGFDDPLWKGEAATAFKGLALKTMASVKAHADPLTGPPSYKTTLDDAAGYLTWAINTVNGQDAEMARRVIERWTDEHTYTIGQSNVTDLSGPKPWHDQNGTTIVHISHYPEMDNELSVQMRKTINELAQNYRKSRNGMPAPAAPLPPGPGPGGGLPDPDKDKDADKYKDDLDKFKNKAKKDLDDLKNEQKDAADEFDKAQQEAKEKAALDAEKAAEQAKKNLPGQALLGAPGNPGADQSAAREAARRQAAEAARRAADEAERNLPGVGAIPNPVGPNLVGPGPFGPVGRVPGGPRTGNLRGPGGRSLTVPGIRSPRLSDARLLNNLKKLGVAPPNLSRLTSGGPPPGSAGPRGAKPGEAAFGAKGPGGRTRTGGPAPMGGGMGAPGGAGGGEQNRERTTWLTEDEEIWGAESEAGAGVLGR